MSLRIPRRTTSGWLQGRWAAFLGGLLAAMVTFPVMSVPVSQLPLAVGGNVPGNLALVPSVEFPTILSQANIGAYDVTRSYIGYFDSEKCYLYQYAANEPDRYFYPQGPAVAHVCADNLAWSGNFMNWAATQTIDPFRLALTGGNRVKDTATETWLEKARYDRDSINYYPNRYITDATTTSNATPASGTFGGIGIRINNLGHQMYFARSALGDTIMNNPGTVATGVQRVRPYNPTDPDQLLTGKATVNGSLVDDPYVYAVSVRVKVCVAGMLEANCKQYSQSAKPEGLIQQYADRLRYSIFGYLNDSDMYRDGGVLRANQKWVAPLAYLPNVAPTANPAKEWDATTGVLVRNPDAAAATATNTAMGITTIADSGVINYLNKFGEMTTRQHKSFDPVSELYYTAVRYFKNLPPVPEYSNVTGTSQQKYELADGFPVITDWQDPIQYRCQANVALGIGDVYTHRDKNLPSATATSGTDEPAKPALVSGDTTVDVNVATQKVFDLEGITSPRANQEFTGRQNSAYIAGLAYDVHTRDMRPDVAGQSATTGAQTMSTYWVDVRENQYLEPKNRNQYWLATKYGGFNVPSGYDPYARTTALPNTWWTTNGETLANGAPRPDNFYVASEADKMVTSLTRAFRKIIGDVRGSGGSLAANTTKLETGAATYQAQFYANSWRGELSSYAVNTSTGQIASTPTWQAGDQFPAWATRNIKTNNGGTMVAFTYATLSNAQKVALDSSSDVVDYLRGDRSKEDPNGSFRTRQGLLGDIVNSQPVYVGKPNDRLYISSTFSGASTYAAFVTARSTRTPVIYVGANDGMLHGFNANTGAETFAFVPNAVIMNNLKDYARLDYSHRYYVDGEITVADAYYSGAWHSVLVGTLGRGGRGIFALDVTDPTNVTFLWEKDASQIPALGNNLGKPIIAQVADGDWRVLVGNGPNGSGGKAQLVMVRLDNGNVTTVDTNTGSDNGMSAVQAWDNDGDGFTDTVYAGDMDGNLWKIGGLTGTATMTRLFAAANGSGTSQPITAAPLVGRKPGTTETWVFFGTGRFLSDSDLGDTTVQSWYGIKDTGALITGRSTLAQRSILDEVAGTTYDVRVLSEAAANDMNGKNGWYMDLVSPGRPAAGERMVLPNIFQGFVLIGTTRIPDTTDPCKPGGRGFVMAVDPFTGARLDSGGFFDVNGDGRVDASDSVTSGGQLVPGSGIGLRDSAPNTPTFMGDMMQLSLDDASRRSIKTYASAMNVRRISWRELLGD